MCKKQTSKLHKLAVLSAFVSVLLLPLRAAEMDVQLSMDRSVLPADSDGTAYLRVALIPELIHNAQKRPPLNIAIVLDRSGSMSGQKIEDAKAGVIEAMNHISPKDKVSFIVYDDNVRTVFSGATLNATTYAWHRQKVEQIQSGGSTAIYAGLQQAKQELTEHGRDGWVNRIVLLSDGLANVGPKNPLSFRRLGTEMAEKGITVSTIGLGLNFNEDLMTGLAQSGDGNAFFVESSRDLAYIFEQEMGQALNVAASDVAIQIEIPEGLRPIRTIGRDGVVEGQTVKINIKQLYGGQEKFALIELQYDAKKADLHRTIESTITFQDTQSNQHRAIVKTGQVNFSNDREKVLASVDDKVVEAVALNRMAEAREEAVALSDKDQNVVAAGMLRETNVKVQSYLSLNAVSTPIQVSEEMAVLDKDAEELQKAPYDNVSRKKANFDSFSVRNQQSIASQPSDDQDETK